MEVENVGSGSNSALNGPMAGDGSGSALIFLGTGCSGAVPSARCLIRPADPPCRVCSQSLLLPQVTSPSYRCNSSLLIDFCPNNTTHSYILFDVGKTFGEQVLWWFSFYKIPRVDSIIMTHEYADAVLGLDDILVIQPFSPRNDVDPTPIYLSQHAMDRVNANPFANVHGENSTRMCEVRIPRAAVIRLDVRGGKFPYLVRKKLKEGQEVRRVAQLEWKIIEENCEKSFVALGLQFVLLPVMHGEDYVSLGFLFGEKYKVAYISDVSRFPQSTEQVISQNGVWQLDLLILDTLYKGGSDKFHVCLPQRKINVQLAHDGLRIPTDL